MFFFIGSEYFNFYIHENVGKASCLISEELIIKLDGIYESLNNFESDEGKTASKKITFVLEGEEEEEWNDYITGEKLEDNHLSLAASYKVSLMRSSKRCEILVDEDDRDLFEDVEIIPYENFVTKDYL